MPFDPVRPAASQHEEVPLTKQEMLDYIRPFDPEAKDPALIPSDYRKRYASEEDKAMYRTMDETRAELDRRYRLNTLEEQEGRFDETPSYLDRWKRREATRKSGSAQER